MDSPNRPASQALLLAGCVLVLIGLAPVTRGQELLPPLKSEPAVQAPPYGRTETPPAPRQVSEAAPPQSTVPGSADPGAIAPPTIGPKDETFPINLPTALRLANARAWDITIASQQLRVAAAQLEGAKVLWVPTLYNGVEYTHHDGPTQAADGAISDSSRSALYAGGAPFAVFNITDAIFTPLAQRQVTRAREANVQTTTNDTLYSVARAYFDAQEAQADLASVEDVARRVEMLVHKTETLAPGLIPAVELARVRAVKFNVAQIREMARQRWRVSSAEVARVLRLKPTVLIQPLEPPHLRMTLISPELTADDLIPIALSTRPELTFNQAQVEAARERLRQERFRPLLPILLARGGGTETPYPLAFGVYGGGQGGSLENFNVRADYDLQALWELRNLGFGNAALIHERKADLEVARSQEFRFRDYVAKEVTEAWAEVASAAARVVQAEQELRQAQVSADQNLEGLGGTKRAAGNIVILVIRPLEVVAALQALNAAYFDYFGTVADYNRAQFRLYRNLGSPAQYLYGHDGIGGPPLIAGCPSTPTPGAPGTPAVPIHPQEAPGQVSR
jgi:outer membrane protein TolC